MNEQMLPPLAPMGARGLSLPPVLEWLMNEGRTITEGRLFFAALCEQIAQSGIPLWRATLHTRMLHPQFLGFNYLWLRGSPVQQIEREHGVQNTEAFLLSPIRVIFEGASALRRRLDIPGINLDFPILGELRDAGATDYVCMGLGESDGGRTALTWATDRPGGFALDDLKLLYDMLPFLTMIIEAHRWKRTAGTLLDVYLGHQSGGRVLSGSVRRGEFDTIHAVLWYCDLRGFTNFTDTLPSDEIISLLNDFFEAMGQPVMARGGEVLKFIGDAMLAIFPLGGPDDSDKVCAAMDAAAEALANLAQINVRQEAEGRRALRCGIALHIGDVSYGNIGAPSRLDFTVIGPAVNKVVRIEDQTKRLERSLLVSADFARRCSHPLVSLGWHPLRGIAEPEEIFASPTAESAVDRLALRTA